jgi:hypothetical protein
MDNVQVAPNVLPNVVMDGVNPSLVAFVTHLAALHSLIFGRPLTITSAKDSQHVAHSLHAEGRAIDVRTNDKDDAEMDLLLHILSYASAEAKIATFDERNVPGGAHLHIEYHGA